MEKLRQEIQVIQQQIQALTEQRIQLSQFVEARGAYNEPQTGVQERVRWQVMIQEVEQALVKTQGLITQKLEELNVLGTQEQDLALKQRLAEGIQLLEVQAQAINETVAQLERQLYQFMMTAGDVNSGSLT